MDLNFVEYLGKEKLPIGDVRSLIIGCSQKTVPADFARFRRTRNRDIQRQHCSEISLLSDN